VALERRADLPPDGAEASRNRAGDQKVQVETLKISFFASSSRKLAGGAVERSDLMMAPAPPVFSRVEQDERWRAMVAGSGAAAVATFDRMRNKVNRAEGD